MPSKNEENVVVSGISGRFPDCLNIKQFREKILGGQNLVTHDDARWPLGTYDLPTGSGKVRHLEDFDAEYFGYNDTQADLLDPLDRLLITEAHSAVLDAGILPETLRGSNTGFFFGSFVDEVQSVLKDKFDAKESIFQYHASRIHEALDLRGPACYLENGCATSLTALQIAVNSIQNGLCDQALVGGVNITMDPTKVNWQMLYETLSADSTCHVFDQKACGYAKGEAAVVIFIQKRSQAKRIYAEILGIHVNADGYKEMGFTYPGWKTQRDLMLAAMEKAGINGKDYNYFEAHGTGTQAGDKTELQSIYEAICQDRNKQPLLIGSVKSITGHAEGASGMVSMAKIIIAYQTKILAPNLHYKVPNPNIPHLTDGTYQVNVKPIPFEGGICGINNFGIGGGNASVVLNSFNQLNKPKSEENDFDICPHSTPRLILMFGRNKNMVYETLEQIEEAKPKLTRGFLSLLNDVSNINPRLGMKSRGYLILDATKETCSKEVDDVFIPDTKNKRNVWFVFSGLGSQWNSMAQQLINIPLFANSIYQSIKYLTSLGYDNSILRNFIINGGDIDPNSEPSIVSIVIVQIALFDTLNELGVQADGIVGHSIGEIAAAYADGCISRKEALKIAYTVEQEVLKVRHVMPGMMAAVGLSYVEALKYRFGTIDVACNNSANIVTMAGNVKDMTELISKLESKNIFVRQVYTNGIIAHTKCMRNTFKRIFMQPFQQMKVNAKERSSKFISTSFVEQEWNYQLCRKPTGEYFGRNILNTVRFYEAIRKAPAHTLFVEIGPMAQLKAPLMRSFESDHKIRYIELMKKQHSDNLNVFMNAIGQLYISGENISLNKLYPKVEYPVPRYTEFLSHIFRYDHSKSRLVTKYPEYFCPNSMNRSVYQESVSLTGDYTYFNDHSVDGLVLYPATGYLYLAWKAISQYHGEPDYLQFPIEFRKINISRATKLSQNETILKCTYFPDTGSFAVEANNNICTTGYVFPLDKDFKFNEPIEQSNSDHNALVLDNESFYRELRVRGYHFGKTFQNVLKIRDDSTYSVVRWTDNVITFLDSILQSSVLNQELRLLYVPTLIENMQVDPIIMMKKIRQCEELQTKVTDVYLNHNLKQILAAGVQVLNVSFKPIARKLEEGANSELVIESHELIGYEETNALDDQTREIIEQYLSKCQETMEKSNGSITEENEKVNNCGLLKLISNKIELLNDQITSELCEELDFDILHSSILSDRFFRTQLDIVIENINLYNKFNVLEINSSLQLIHPKLLKVIGRPLFGFAMNNLIYTVAHSQSQMLPEHIRTDDLIKFVDFDLDKYCIPYRDLELQEFVIFRDPRLSLHQIDKKIDYNLFLRSIETVLAENGFFLAFLRNGIHPIEQKFCNYRNESFQMDVERFITFAEEAGLTYIGKKCDTFTCCSILFRKVEKVEHREKIIEIFNENLSWLEVLKSANRDPAITRIWIHSSEPQSGIVGLIRGLAKDISRNKIKYIYFDNKSISLEKALKICRRTQLLQNAFLGTKLGSYRHITFSESPDLIDGIEQFELRQVKSGDLSSFKPFVKQPLSSLGYKEPQLKSFQLGPDSKNRDESQKILVQIDKAALNFRDVMIASARMSPSDVSDHMAWDDVVLGLEFAGHIPHNGQRVMGFNNCKALGVSILANKEFLWPVPPSWTMLQASTVPVVYATCYYGLFIRGKLQKGESVLIHAGTGGIGLAAINICLAMKCKVFTTAGTEEKREFLNKTYPQIGRNCIGNSRNCSFETMIMQETNGQGVDLVLNSLTDEMFWASLRCLGNNGRFCEIGKYQFMNDDIMDVNILLRNKTFHGVHLDRLFPDGKHGKYLTPKAIRERKQVWHLVNQGIQCGVVKPLPYTVFQYNQIETAFRYMSTGKHIGKVVVEFRNERQSTPLKVKAVPRTYFEPTKSYIITGGLGGMGLELMFWMQERGAKNFVLTSRSGVKTMTHKLLIKMTEKLGCKVIVSTEDGGSPVGVSKMIETAEILGPIGGVFLSTLVLENESIDKITTSMYEKVMYAKSTQAVVFDKMLRKLSYPIDYFIGFSSISAGRGFPGQTNYAFANSILERVCEQRRKDGLNGLAIQWGMIGDVGYVADNLDIKESIRGYKPQPIVSCWHYMDRFMQSKHSVCGSFVRVEQNVEKSNVKISLLDQICNVMGIKNKTKLDPKMTLTELGLDSMMATEIGNIFENEFHMAMTAKDIRAMTIEKITAGLQPA